MLMNMCMKFKIKMIYLEFMEETKKNKLILNAENLTQINVRNKCLINANETYTWPRFQL